MNNNNICPYCDHSESSKNGDNVFTIDYIVDKKFHHREEEICKCHCHKRFID